MRGNNKEIGVTPVSQANVTPANRNSTRPRVFFTGDLAADQAAFNSIANASPLLEWLFANAPAVSTQDTTDSTRKQSTVSTISESA